MTSKTALKIVFASMKGLSSQTVIENAVKLSVSNADNKLCLQSSESLQVVYLPAKIDGSLTVNHPERGLNSTLILKLSIPAALIQKEKVQVDLYFPKEISQFLKQEFASNFSQTLMFHGSVSTGIGSKITWQYSPITDGTGNLHYLLASSSETQVLFTQSEALLVFSSYLPIDVQDSMSEMYGTVTYNSSPVATFSVKTTKFSPIGLQAASITGNFNNKDLELNIVANQSLPSNFTLIIKTQNNGFFKFKDAKSISTCLEVSGVSNPGAVCNQTLRLVNGAVVSNDDLTVTSEISGSEIKLVNPFAGLKLKPGQLRREVSLKIHNLIFKSDYMTSNIEIFLTLFTYTSGDSLLQTGPEVKAIVISPCPKSCTQCSSIQPTVCYQCVPGIAIQDQTCWLPMKRYNAFLSLQIVINGLIFVLLCILGVHSYLAIVATPKDSRYGLVYFTDGKMATSLLAYLQSIGVMVYSFVAGNYLMVWASAGTLVAQIITNIAVYFWLRKLHKGNSTLPSYW